jgi:CRP/FNR family nitrogen fixation transcriptional regulator
VELMLKQRADMRESVLALIREELRAAHEHLVTLGCQSARERVASFLSQLARRAGAKDGEAIDIELGRQDMADYLGLTLETISRTLSEFKRAGAIDLPGRRRIVIRSRAKLRAQSVAVN